MPEINGRLTFANGIERVLHQQHAEEARLPEARAFVPGDAPVMPRLNEVLYQPTLEQNLLAALRPTVADRNNLSPDRYVRLSEQAEGELRDLAGRTATPEERRRLDDLAGLLTNERELRDLLSSYRHVLHQG